MSAHIHSAWMEHILETGIVKNQDYKCCSQLGPSIPAREEQRSCSRIQEASLRTPLGLLGLGTVHRPELPENDRDAVLNSLI